MEIREIEDPEEDDLEKPDDSGDGSSRARKARLEKHLAEVDAETASLSGLPPVELKVALREVGAGSRTVLPETLVRISEKAHRAGDRRLLDDAFAALMKIAAPMLGAQAWGVTDAEREEEVQEVLLQLFQDIRTGKAAMAGRVFAGWARRRANSRYRKRAARFEGSYKRVEPTADHPDPVDEIPERIPSHETRVMLEQKIRDLPDELRTAVIRVHVLGFKREEVAVQMNVSVRTLHDWLKKAAEVLGQDGDDDEH